MCPLTRSLRASVHFLVNLSLPIISHKCLIYFSLTSDAKEGEGIQKVNHVTVFERPGLQEFLQRTSEFADLVLFTAGLEGSHLVLGSLSQMIIYPFYFLFFV